MAYIDHFSIPVADLAVASQFYDAVLATLGLRRCKEREGAIGYGPIPGLPPIFWILARRPAGAASPGIGLHLAFGAVNRGAVQAFHRTAIAYGGTDAGAPGERPHYTSGYYGCFIVDRDGYKIEAVAREALSKEQW